MAYSDEQKVIKGRADKAVQTRALWDALYDEVYALAIPMRRPAARTGKAQRRLDDIYDSTLVDVAARGAAQLHESFFPAGEPFFAADVSPIVKTRAALDPQAKAQIDAERAQLEGISRVAYALTQNGEFETATFEMCCDLMAGTGAILIPEGDDEQPARFLSVPVDELAVELDGFGRDALIVWSKKMTRRQIMGQWPTGRMPTDWQNDTDRSTEHDVRQVFARERKGWSLTVFCEGCEDVLYTGTFRTQPLIVARYMRIPGEEMGRGPLMLALADARTLNKGREIYIRAALMDMLGVWLYRPGGAFNPQTAKLAPGAMWPVTTTGGVMGPDVARLDTGPSRVDIGKILTDDLRGQIRTLAGDDVRSEGGATPLSASEIMARAQRKQQAHRAAYARMAADVIPLIALRLIDIAISFRLVRDVKLPKLLTRIVVTSPMAVAMRADQVKTRLDYAQIVGALAGPEALDEHLKRDDVLDAVADALMIPVSERRSPTERAAIRQQKAQQAQAMQAAQFALEAAKVTKGAAQDEAPAAGALAGM